MVPTTSSIILVDSLWVGCINDSSPSPYYIHELDGDSVVVSITSPLNGSNSGAFNPAPQPSNILTWPIPTGVYSNGFSLTSPFGNGSVVDLLANQQVLNLHYTIQGDVSIGIKLYEYRNKMRIVIDKREIQRTLLN